LRGRDKLTAISIRRKRDPGLYHDGAGLYLQVTEYDTQSWIFKFTLKGRARQMGLGSAELVSLAEARRKRDDARRLLLDGIDPIEARRSARQARELAVVEAVSFKQAAMAYMSAHEAGWRNVRHAQQWPESLSLYVYPVLGALSVQAIDTALVLKVLEPIWTVKPSTASRVRGRIECVLDWARTRGHRIGENPARWRGHLDKLLPARTKVRKVKHHPALPFAEIGTFMVALHQQDSIAARALEFVILTAARSGEVLGARWEEIDLTNRVWTVPEDRMKAQRQHRVPLSEAALSVLNEMWPLRNGGFVFPSQDLTGALGHAALFMLLRRMGRGDVTTHGFRSTFRDWAAECTHYPNEVVEMALAHTVGSKVEAAYRRGDLFEKRRRLMADWATFCATLPAAVEDNVFQLRGSPIPA
jgi:integrase